LSKVLSISYWLFIIAVIIALLGFVENKNVDVVCHSMEISIDRPNKNFFVMEDDVRNMVLNLGYGEGMRIDLVDVAHLEKLLNNNSSIGYAEVYSTIDGVLKIELSQRNPILRVFTEYGDSYYIDENGWMMPLSDKFTSRVLVANGAVKTSFSMGYDMNIMDLKQEDQRLKDLYQLASFINNDSFLKAQIVQIYVKENGDLELIPRVGNQEIIFGKAENIKQKFDKLMVFYKQGLSKTGWNGYKRINLKYNNQVVCTKK
jgi:cell division protein FtsQ